MTFAHGPRDATAALSSQGREREGSRLARLSDGWRFDPGGPTTRLSTLRMQIRACSSTHVSPFTIQVKFAGDRVGHAVCYVGENKAYLDYNNRKYVVNLERSGETIRQIAKKIAASFELEWTTAAEFTYNYETLRKKLTRVVVKTDPPDKDPDRGTYGQ